MKVTRFFTVAVFCLCSTAFMNNTMAQQTMYIAKGSTVVPLSGVEEVTFEDAAPGEALIVHKSGGSSVDTILLNDIEQISFSGGNMSVEMQSGDKDYVINSIAKLMFKNVGTTAMRNPGVQDIDMIVWLNPAGEVIVESPVAIKSLSVFSVDGKMISQQSCIGVEKQCVISLQSNAAGVYLLQVETEQGIVVKKVINPSSK